MWKKWNTFIYECHWFIYYSADSLTKYSSGTSKTDWLAPLGMKTGSLGRSNNSNRFSLILFAISLGFSTCNVTLLYLLYCRWRRFVFFAYSFFFQQLLSPFTIFAITFWITILKLFFMHRLFLLVTNLLPPSYDILVCLNYELFYYYDRRDLNLIIFFADFQPVAQNTPDRPNYYYQNSPRRSSY